MEESLEHNEQHEVKQHEVKQSENKKAKYANWALRLGLAAVLLWSVKTKFTTPDKVSGMMGALGLGFANNLFVILLGTVLTITAIWLILGYKVKYPAIFLSLFFSVTIVLGLLNGFTVGPALWKDFGLLGASLALALT